MTKEKDILKNGLSASVLTKSLQTQLSKYGSIVVYCVQHEKRVRHYIIKENGYPLLLYIGYTEEGQSEEDMIQIICNSCSCVIDTEKKQIQIMFL